MYKTIAKSAFIVLLHGNNQFKMLTPMGKFLKTITFLPY